MSRFSTAATTVRLPHPAITSEGAYRLLRVSLHERLAALTAAGDLVRSPDGYRLTGR